MLAPQGILPLGWFRFDGAKPALLLGDVGGSQWDCFARSGYMEDWQPDPLDRWTKASVSPVALAVDSIALYPFGEKVWPFQQWAKEAMGVSSSPLGLLIHPVYGLWMALRAALVFDEAFDLPATQRQAPPCSSCADKPCLTSCPVNAFAGDVYHADLCRKYVRSAEGEECRDSGCLARRACPVGREYEYSPNQQAFHMSIFARIRS